MVSEMASTDDGDISSHQGQSVIACTVVMLALATVTVALRLYTRRSILGSLGSDDWIVLAALVTMSPVRHRAASEEVVLKASTVLLGWRQHRDDPA